MRVVVTGADGFVGRHLVAHLEACGDEVVPSDRTRGGPDITDLGAVGGFLTGLRPDAVYHLAGQSDVGGSWTSPVATFRSNAEGTLNILLACRDAEVSRVLAVSSADIYGRVDPDRLPVDEDAPLMPVSPYAASKVAADYLGLQAHLGWGLGVIRVRAFNHLGPGQTDRFVAPALAARIAANERDGGTVVPVGNLAARRDFTDVRDVVRAYRLLCEHGTAGEAYNICSGHDIAVQELAEQLVDRAKHTMSLQVDPELVRPVDVPVLRGDNRRLRDATGWEPDIALSETLDDLLEEWRRQESDRR